MTVKYIDQDIEQSSGKAAGEENFPVGSILIRADLRAHIACFYDFARAADDIADSDALSADEKLYRLQAFEDVLTGKADGLSKPAALRASLQEVGVSTRHGVDLIAAFKQDAAKQRYRTMDDLMAYCALSANPVGRYLLDLHGEDTELYPASDALCSSLQILNHLQDCAEDYAALDRAYIPTDWLEAEGETLNTLSAGKASPGFRRVMDRMLTVCTALNETAEALESGLSSRRLAAESAVILRLAKRLTEHLKRGDPLASRVGLSKWDFISAGLAGTLAGFAPRAHKRALA